MSTHKPILEEIRARLREERVRLGASQENFAESAGVSRRTQMKYENGETSPDVAYLSGIADQGADVFYILSGKHNYGAIPEHVGIDRLPGFGPAPTPARIMLPEFLVQRKTGMTPLENIRWALNPTHAMEPEIEYNALVLIDVTQSKLSELIDGAIYAYSLWDRPGIRRVLNRRDHWAVVGSGKGADTVDVYKDEAESFEIFGTVVGVI